VAALAFVLLLGSSLRAQQFTYRGFAQGRAILYPQSPAGPVEDTKAVGDLLVRFEPSYRPKPVPWFKVSASFDGRADTLGQVEREWRVDWLGRGVGRPALSARQLDGTIAWRRANLDLGKQFVRWGKADILNPTDRFAPRDFLEVTDSEFLGVTGARLQYERGPNTVDLVWVPWFTPSRIPLFDQRWTVLPSDAAGLARTDLGSRVPGGSQVGARWNLVAPGYEFSISGYSGFNHLPLVEGRVIPLPVPLGSPPLLSLQLLRTYPSMRMVGGDAAVPFAWFTLKGEVAYLGNPGHVTDDYVLYVLQVERQTGELSLVGGYAGEVVTTSRSAVTFAPDRGLAKSFLGRASYTIDANRSAAVEAAVRQTGDGVWAKFEYSQASGQHWRTTVNATVIGGNPRDFLGQYRRNSHGVVTLRYSF
jgi:hypothetical protein